MKIDPVIVQTALNFANVGKPTDAELDIAFQPIIDEMAKVGALPDNDHAFVELQGVYEFGLVPVIYCSPDKELYFNVNPDGSIDQF